MNKITNIFQSTIRHFSTNAPNNKIYIYNNNFQYVCSNTAISFSLMGPSHKIIDDSTVIMRSFKCLNMRCANRKQMYIKGSVRINQSFDLNNIKQLLSFNFQSGADYFVQNDQQKTTIKLIDQLKSSKYKKSLKESELLVQISSEKGSMSFPIKMKDFQQIKKILHMALPELYGIRSTMELKLSNLLSMERNGILEMEQVKSESQEFFKL